ncbi:hypothetical protein ALP59_02230 [Pseudomonas savastanoi]|uniref:Uncharacterized protein n=1 Tax=Pseudomonas savastanoi TaxID=29438 RepID=A0A3M5GGJ5_PSESS|nr:hypothetical protein ALP59_02230 [Pseudomonas savastanoi]
MKPVYPWGHGVLKFCEGEQLSERAGRKKQGHNQKQRPSAHPTGCDLVIREMASKGFITAITQFFFDSFVCTCGFYKLLREELYEIALNGALIILLTIEKPDFVL